MKAYAIDGIIPVVDPQAFVHPDAVLIGDVIVGPDCYVGPGASLRGDMGRIVLEAGSSFQDNCVAHTFPGRETRVGPGCHVGHGAILHGCILDARVLVGMNAVIMDNVHIGQNAVIAACALVKEGFQVPGGRLAAGAPARIVRRLTDQEQDWMHRGGNVYRQLARRCLATLTPVHPLPQIEPDRPLFGSRESETRPLHEFRKFTGSPPDDPD